MYWFQIFARFLLIFSFSHSFLEYIFNEKRNFITCWLDISLPFDFRSKWNRSYECLRLVWGFMQSHALRSIVPSCSGTDLAKKSDPGTPKMEIFVFSKNHQEWYETSVEHEIMIKYMILVDLNLINLVKSRQIENWLSKRAFSQKRVPEAIRIRISKEPPQFSGSFGNLNIKNRWMAIFIERKRFCHFILLTCTCGLPVVPVVPVLFCGLLWYSVVPIVPCGVP